MSAFVVNLTPTRLRVNKKNETREPTDVIFAPFSAKATVTFEEVPITKIARRLLKVVNPSDDEIQVKLTKGLSPDYNVSLEWTEHIIPARGHVTMEIVWNPLSEIGCKDNIQLTDNRNFRKDVTIIMKSIQKQKVGVKRYPTLSSGAGPVKTLKLKSPTRNHKQFTVSKQQQRKRQSCIQPATRKVQRNNFSASPLLEKNSIANQRPNFTISDALNSSSQGTYHTNKENVNPVTPIRNASTLFDKIQFSPATVTKSTGSSNLEYLASLPTPNNLRQSLKSCESGTLNIKKLPLIYSPDTSHPTASNQIRDNLCPIKAPPEISVSPHVEENVQHEEGSSPGRTFLQMSYNEQPIEAEKRLIQVQPINKTFELKYSDKSISISSDSSEENVDIMHHQNCEMQQTRTPTISLASSRLSIIQEETGAPAFQKTFEVRTPVGKNNLKRDVELVGTPLRKYSESMRDLSEANTPQVTFAIQGSMPNLNNLSTIQSIEQNRYYNCMKQSNYRSPNNRDRDNLNSPSRYMSPNLSYNASAVDLLFNQNEILAASSRFNIHEAGGKIAEHQKSPMALKCEPKTPNNKFQKRLRENESLFPSNFLYPSHSNALAVSPPKRSKVDLNDKEMRCGFRIKNWNRVQTKNIRLQNTLSLVRKPITPRKIKEEPRLQFYENSHHIQQYINPDPFAATTILDPFLSSSIYLDERAIDKYESQMKKCLNALVTIPAELDPNCDQKIDVGRIFNEVRNKEFILAPTKEEQSMTYLTKARMVTLRAAAYRLYTSEEISIPCSKIAIYIKKGAIKIRQDRNLHLDVVMQRNILELLLSFNPLWLRIGLEVVFNEVIHLHSNSDIVGLSTFILNRLFKDKYLERKYSKAFTLSENYSEHIKEHTLQKMLLLLLFLDKAKNNRIIKHNPCLFVKKSPYKETKDILLRFSSELLASMGDICKDLRRLGYVLTHKQVFLDEFDYAFKNLAIDLRDGVRLTRVMEIILLRDDFTKQLRCPAISRLQRIFNVNLGLKALANADFDVGNIYAADIVDGHREKTLSLLWQIIYKFRAPKFIAAATVLQKWWRNSWLQVSIRRRIRFKQEQRMYAAAVVIQSVYRGYISRRLTKMYKFERESAAVIIQKYTKRFLVQQKYDVIRSSCVIIQRWYKLYQSGKEERERFVKIRKNVIMIQCWYRRLNLARKILQAASIIHDTKKEAKLRYEKAIIIQRTLKSYIIHRKLKSIVNGFVNYNRRSQIEFRSATKIQSYFKMITTRRYFVEKRCAAISIQRHWRSYQLTRILRAQFLGKVEAAIAIQQHYRNFKLMQLERKNYLMLKSSVVKMQSIFRANRSCKIQQEIFTTLKESVITIQLRFKATLLMKATRVDYLNSRNLIIDIQRKFRANQLMRYQRDKYTKLRSATILIQQRFRAQRLMRAELTKYEKIRSSAIIIQQKLRATLLGKKERFQFMQMRSYTILIQQRFRANILKRRDHATFLELRQATIYVQRTIRKNYQMEFQRTEYLNLKRACVLIQQKFRANRLMNAQRLEYLKLVKSATIIQQRWRALCAMRIQRAHYLNLKKSAIIMQHRFRANVLMEQIKYEYCLKRNAAIFIQRQFKATLKMKTERNQYLQLKTSATNIQQRWRALRAMRSQRAHYLILKKSAVIMQQRFRANVLMEQIKYDYCLKRNAAIIIQRQFKATLQMEIERNKYLQLKTSATNIQQRWRALCAMRSQRAHYLILRKSAVIMQQRFRAKMLMEQIKYNYCLQRNAAILIQLRFKATLEMKTERNQYLQLKTSATYIQQRWRALCAMRSQRAHYLILRKSAVIMQQRFRAKMLMEQIKYNYCLQRNAAILIQLRFKATLQMKSERNKYLQLKTSAANIQQRWRALRAMRSHRAHYLNLKNSAVIIQQRFRAYVLMEQTRYDYQLKRHAATLIQRKFIAYKKMKEATENYSRIRQSVITLQKHFKAYIQMNSQRNDFIQKKDAAIKIQNWYRATQLMLSIRSKYQITLKSVNIIQQRWRSTLKMIHEQEQYLNLKKSTIIIQQKYRSYIQMKIEQNEFLLLKKSALIIQERFRAKRDMLKLRNQYLLIRSLTICIQRKFRATRLMKFEQAKFIKLKSAAIFCQEKYRAKIQMREECKNFQNLKHCVMGLQTFGRGFLARKDFNARITPEVKELFRQKKAAKVIQRHWRGFRVRRQWNNLRIVVIREKIRELKETAKSCNSLRFKMITSIKLLKGRFNVQEGLSVLTRFDMLSRTVPHLLMQHSSFISTFCYGIMAQAIRSEADKQVIEFCSRIILNLARYNSTDTFQENGLVTVAQMLLRWCDKDCGIFNTLCTLIWVFAQCPIKNKKIGAFMVNTEAIYMLRETKKLLLRKENMKQNVRKLNIAASLNTQKSFPPKTLPSLLPDFGIIHSKPYTFVNSVYGFNVIIAKLGINV